MKIVKLTETIAVSGQIQPGHIAAIAEAGYRVLVNNRPDGEEAGQPSSAEIAAAAAAAGLEYHFLPVTAADFPGPDAARMAALLGDVERKLLAFCRTGTRCANLWVVTRPQDELDRAAQVAGGQGFDLSMAARALGRG